MKKGTLLVSILSISMICLVACNGKNAVGSSSLDQNSNQGGNNTSISKPGDADYYTTLTQRAKIDASSTKSFIEDFTGGMSDDTWLTLDGAWHTDSQGWEHGGMKSRNLFYTKDSQGNDYLAIKARGWYTTEDPETKHKPEGGCIISKNHLGPGRYEITMAAMPREGAVSTMWTYCTTTGSEATSQNEIDIELGGTSNSGTHFEEYWATSWTKKSNKETDKVGVITNKDLSFYMNDGKMHTYTFDWYTEYPGADDPRVDWFVDGVFVNSITGSMVPDTEMPLWVGVWFPPAWCGNPTFIEDYMLVDKVTYQAFDENNQYVNSCRAEAGYNKGVPSKMNIKTIDFDAVTHVNKLSNADFEMVDVCSKDNSYYGWVLDKDFSKGSITFDSDKSTGSKALKLVAGADDGTTYHGEYISQVLTDAYAGFKYQFKIDAKALDTTSNGNVEIYSISKSNKRTLMKSIPVNQQNYTTLSYDIVMPEGSKALEIDLTSENGTILYDNASLYYLK